MEKLIKFSFVVPVYNTFNYLDKCLSSILSQTSAKWEYEIILVNDGSTDKSEKICKFYAEKNEVVKYFYKENGGLSSTRNFGLDKATGDYIVFVDSDDYIEDLTLHYFLESLELYNFPDILITRLKKIGESINLMDNDFDKNIVNKSKEEIIEYLMFQGETLWPAVKYVIRRDLIEKNKLRFLEGHYHEDIDWTVKLLLETERYGYCPYYWYNHKIDRKDSITNLVTPKRTFDVINILQINFDYLSELTISEKLKRIVKTRLTSSLLTNLRYYHLYDKNERRKICFLLNENVEILEYLTGKKGRVLKIMTKLIGWNKSLYILSTLNRNVR